MFTIKVQYSRADETGPTFQFQRSAPLWKAIITILYLPGSVEIELTPQSRLLVVPDA